MLMEESVFISEEAKRESGPVARHESGASGKDRFLGIDTRGMSTEQLKSTVRGLGMSGVAVNG